jgi:ActR/RegA family two-component response regulator
VNVWTASTIPGKGLEFPERAAMSNNNFHAPIILLVEDDANLRERLATALRAHGCRVQAAADSVEAVHVSAMQAFDYAVIEPKSSDDLIRRLRGSSPKLRILVFTGYRRSASEAMRDLGVCFLQKPADADDVLCALGLGCSEAEAATPREPLVGLARDRLPFAWHSRQSSCSRSRSAE